MNLYDLCEPIFLEVCKLQRLARSCGPGMSVPRLSFVIVRGRFEQLLRDAETQAHADRFLAGQFQQVKAPLIYFIDDVLNASRLPIASEWGDRPLEMALLDRLVGADRFWDLLQETLNQPGRDAEERLAIFYTCLGLGFKGKHRDHPAELQEAAQQIRYRLAGSLAGSPTAKFCPESYLVNELKLFQRPTRWATWVFAGFFIFAIGALVFYYVIFDAAAKELAHVLQGIIKAPPALIVNP